MTIPKNEAKELANILSGMGEGGVPEDLWDRDDHADGDVYVARAAELLLEFSKPIDMVLHCPVCGEQHIDAPVACDMSVGCEEAGTCFAAAHGEPERCVAWDNPPHRSHLCHNCGHIWRPADVPTNGVEAVKTKGKDDRVLVPLDKGYVLTSRNERRLRRMLARRSGISHLYLDDGEAQGQEHGITIDFMRESIDDIDAKLGALGVARYESTSAHVPFKTGDDGVPEQITDRNGEVVLSLCKVCGKAEVELDEACVASPDNVDMQVVSELDAVASMLKRADEEGLLVEVVAAFGQYRAGGDSVADAAFCALHDWDI